MPELPDIEAYLAALRTRVLGQTLTQIRIGSPFLLRTVDPPLSAVEGQEITALSRIGKRIVFTFANGISLVLHLMIAGRLHWAKPGVKLVPRRTLAAFDFPEGTLTLTEAGSKRRASLHVTRTPGEYDPGGLDPFELDAIAFQSRLAQENRTLKRALTDPRILSGIGNAYSDEILHAAQLSPIAMTGKLTPPQWAALYQATRETLILWRDRFLAEAANAFPEKVTAFRPDMAVHGRFGQPCPRCAAPIQRIRYADNETNYCAPCQTEGKLLADRSMSRLLGKDWPKTLDELETLRRK